MACGRRKYRCRERRQWLLVSRVHYCFSYGRMTRMDDDGFASNSTKSVDRRLVAAHFPSCLTKQNAEVGAHLLFATPFPSESPVDGPSLPDGTSFRASPLVAMLAGTPIEVSISYHPFLPPPSVTSAASLVCGSSDTSGQTMESTEKPFKTIEVIDARTSQACKVACMSCIRGHRTTSCGIPVCRTKIFWTVKRPGRPSNSCTCRYGGGGGCKCVVAASKVTCPHKSKKGEKRSGECRCDEQGRYCCVLDPQHWTALFALQKPTIEFFPTREALEARTVAPTPFTAPATPAYAAPSPHFVYAAPHTPGSLNGTQPVYGVQDPFVGVQPQTRSPPVRTRFQMMGIGGPQGPRQVVPDPFAWEGQAPPAPLPFHQTQHQVQPPQQEEASSCCQSLPSSLPPQLQPHMPYDLPDQTFDRSTPDTSYVPIAGVLPNPITSAEQIPSPTVFDYNKMTTDYFNYQLPNAICQNCGLSGCTCKHCPPVLQNFDNGSWAQCCGRKHARTLPPTTSQPSATTDTFVPTFSQHEATSFAAPQHYSPLPQFTTDLRAPIELAGLQSPAATSEFTNFDLDHDMAMPIGVSTPLSLSDFLMSDLESTEKDRVLGESEVGNNEEEDSGGGGCGCGCGP
nr:hypothetical protein CFP56_32405 [Quercus suber]